MRSGWCARWRSVAIAGGRPGVQDRPLRAKRVSQNTRIAAFFGAISILLASVMAEQQEGTRYTAY